MAPCVLLFALLVFDLHWISAAPIIDALQDRWLISAFSSPTSTTSNVSAHDAISYADVESFLLSSSPTPTHSARQPDVTQQDDPYPFSFSLTQVSSPEPTGNPVMTITVTEEQPTTITISPSPTTITEIITVTETPTPTPSTQPDVGLGKASWTAPLDMEDLSSFNVTKFQGGVQNMKILAAIPDDVITSPDDADSSRSSSTDVKATGSVMQIFYPENSINPAQKPQGGAEFYASPIDISSARNVTLQYSVFFPTDFEWVLAGKLPGLYGGHEGCSGGNAALDCFSTRLMWRKGGAGELYLYAPKDKQTDDLCTDPASVCDAAYGLSIGRSSFKWKAGGWTTVRQTVYLNTPGEQDGTFTLDVDGETAIHREDVFYREDLAANKEDDKHEKTAHPPTKTSTRKHAAPTSSSSGDDGGLLGPVLGGILGSGSTRRRNAEKEDDESYEPKPTSTKDMGDDDENDEDVLPQPKPSCPAPTATATTPDEDEAIQTDSVKAKEVRFAGIFFSTFFGGHDEKYATPKDQYVWFKDWALVYNS